MRDYRAKSFWLEQTSPGYSESAPLEGLVRADTLIIGGGITGLSAAWRLKQAQPGMRTVLLEAETVGFGASGRGTGIIAALHHILMDAPRLRLTAQQAAAGHRYLRQATHSLDELVRRYQLSIGYEQTGFLRVATSARMAQRLQRQVEQAQALGIEEVDWLNESQVRERLDTPLQRGAWADASGALLNPALLTREMKRLAAAAGAEVYEHSPVLRLVTDALIRAQTPHGAVEADRLVLATGAYTAQFALLRSRQLPLHKYSILTEPLTQPQLDAIGWHGRQGVQDARRLPHSCRLTPDQRLLVNGGNLRYFIGNQTGADHHEPSYRELERFTAILFPALRGVRVTQRWGSPISATPDGIPRIGFIGSDQRVIYCVGNMSNGAAMALQNGWTIADLLLQQHTERTEVCFVNRRAVPLPPEPLRAVLAHGILGITRARDVWDG